MSRVSLPSWLHSKLIENGILYPQLNSKLLCVDTKSDERWLREQWLIGWKRQWGNMLRESDWIVLCRGRHCSRAGKCSKMLDLHRFKIEMALTDVVWKKIKTPQTQKCNGQRCPTWTQFKFIFFQLKRQTIMWYANYQLFAIIHRPLPQLPPLFIHNLYEQMKAKHVKWSIFPNNKILMEATEISFVGVKALATV